MKLDIVMQGPIWEITPKAAEYYLKSSFVNSVIISTWENENIPYNNNPKIVYIKNKKPEENDKSNVNMQIVSSLEGIKITSSDLVLKIRTDEVILHDSLEMLFNFIKNGINDHDLIFFNKTKPKGNLYFISMSNKHPFHPKDHIVCGYREDVLNFFNIPLLPKELHRVDDDFNKNIRPETYFGGMYFKQFYPEEMIKFFKNYKEYLVDNPTNQEAIELSNKMRDKIFKVLPKLKIIWTKYPHFPSYPYEWYEQMGEYSFFE